MDTTTPRSPVIPYLPVWEAAAAARMPVAVHLDGGAGADFPPSPVGYVRQHAHTPGGGTDDAGSERDRALVGSELEASPGLLEVLEELVVRAGMRMDVGVDDAETGQLCAELAAHDAGSGCGLRALTSTNPRTTVESSLRRQAR